MSSVRPPQPLISLILNPASGHHGWGGESIKHQLISWFEQANCEVVCYLADHPHDLADLAKQALSAYRHREGAVVVAGGDGSINSVAQAMLYSNVPLGIIPLGTFNYVARALHIPLDLKAAVDVIVAGHHRGVHVGRVNHYIYLNNASIGLYPHLIEQREADKGRFGRYRAVAMVSGFAVLMRQHQKMRLRMIVDGNAQPIDTPMVFFGNNQLQLQDMHLSLSDYAAQGKLAVVAVNPVSRLQILSLIARMQLGTFEQAPEVQCFAADQVCIESKHPQAMKLAIDGEVVQAKSPLRFSVARDALQVMVPHAAASV